MLNFQCRSFDHNAAHVKSCACPLHAPEACTNRIVFLWFPQELERLEVAFDHVKNPPRQVAIG